MAKEFDIYSLIRSDEIREHFRRNRSFTITEQEKLITHCYEPLDKKIEFLRTLREKSVDGDRKKIENMIRLYDKVMDQIYSTTDRMMIIHQYLTPLYIYDESDISDLFYSVDGSCFGLYPSYADLKGHLENLNKEYKNRRYEKESKAHVVYVLENGEYERGLTFSLLRQNGLYYPRDFNVTDDWLQENGIDVDTYRRKQDYIQDYELPFKDGDRIKVRLPFWKKSIFGVFSRYEKNGSVHQSFFLNGHEHIQENELDLSYQDFELSSGYSVFDWVYRYSNDYTM